MKSALARIAAFTMAVLTLLCFASCDKEKNDTEPEESVLERVTLVYAINRSNLEEDFAINEEWMLEGMKDVDSEHNRLLVYRTDSKTETGLYEASRQNNTWQWTKVKGYARETASTNPAVLKQVLGDVCALYPNVKRTLIFWGHGTAWVPKFTDQSVRSISSADLADVPQMHAFGGEYGEDGNKWMEIDELADAIPAGAFDTIWFDNCYMSSIEVAYQLRNKAHRMVAYPTEVYNEGLNYNRILPLIMKEDPNLISAAKSFFDFYNNRSLAVTVAVLDLDKIEDVASACAAIMHIHPEVNPVTGISNYGTGSYRFYDLAQMMAARAEKDSEEYRNFKTALDAMILYHAASRKDFDGAVWDNPDLSCVSIANFRNTDSKEDRYYRTLDWWNRMQN